MKQRFAVVAVCASLSILAGCANSQAGQGPDWNPNAFHNTPVMKPFSIIYNLTGQSTLSDIQTNLMDYEGKLLDQAVVVKEQEAGVSSVTFLGALAATFGAVYKKTALILTGAGVGGAGYAVEQHFQLDAQATAYRNAADNTNCVTMAAYAVSDDDLVLVQSTAASDDDRNLGLNAKKLVVLRANAVNRRLLEALETASRPTAASENDWAAYLEKQKGITVNPTVNLTKSGPALQAYLENRKLTPEDAKTEAIQKILAEQAQYALLRVRTMAADLQKCSLSLK